MARDPRIEHWLERYPDQLDDGELAELRAAAELDPTLEAEMEAIHRAERVLRRGLRTAEGAPLSAGDQVSAVADEFTALAAAGANSGGRTDAGIQALGSRGTSTRAGVGDAVEALGSRGTSTRAQGSEAAMAAGAPTAPSANEPSSTRAYRPWVLSLVALLVLGVSLRLQEGADAPLGTDGEFQPRGGDAVPPAGALWIRGVGDPEARLPSGTHRPTELAVTFRATVASELDLVLVEVSGGQAHVLHPPAGQRWSVPPGSHVLQSESGGSDYRPSGPGPSAYVLLGSANAWPGRGAADLESILTSWPGAAVLDRVEIIWEAR